MEYYKGNYGDCKAYLKLVNEGEGFRGCTSWSTITTINFEVPEHIQNDESITYYDGECLILKHPNYEHPNLSIFITSL